MSFLGILAPVIVGVAMPAGAADTYNIDNVHSMLVFKVKHLGVGNNYGRFNTLKGQIVLDRENPAKSKVDVEIAADSIDTNDAKRDAHLKSPDFFDVKQFPVIKFTSKSVKKTGNTYEVAGDLSLHGVTKPLTIKADVVGEGKDPWGGQRVGFETQFVVKRSDYGMKYMLEGLSDEIHVTLAVEGIKQG